MCQQSGHIILDSDCVGIKSYLLLVGEQSDLTHKTRVMDFLKEQRIRCHILAYLEQFPRYFDARNSYIKHSSFCLSTELVQIVELKACSYNYQSLADLWS